jgi:predicted PolB exonuclease-like 3'-5' exonuclease
MFESRSSWAEAERVIALDIETVPDLWAARRLTGVPDTDAAAPAAFEALLQQQGSATAFPPIPLHRIVAIGWVEARIQRDARGWAWFDLDRLEAISGGAFKERDMLRSLAARFAAQPLLVTWNGIGFDAPVIAWRAARYGIPLPEMWRHGRSRRAGYLDRGSSRHVDLGLVFGGRMPRLDHAAAAFGLPGKGDDAAGAVSGADTVHLVNRQEWTRLERYVLRDAVQTYLLFLGFAAACGSASLESTGAALRGCAEALATEGGHDDLVAYARRRAATLPPDPVPERPENEPKLQGYA